MKAVIALLAVAIIGGAVWFTMRGNKPAGTGGLSARHESLVLKGEEVCSAFRLSNDGPAITIKEVRLNDEHPAPLAAYESQRYSPSSKSYPVELDNGDSVLIFHRDFENRPPEHYREDVTSITVVTATGEMQVTPTSAKK